jgi:MFS family permease
MNITPGEIRGPTVALYYMVISLSGLLLGPGTVGLLSDQVFGNENLNFAAATVPAIFGIPVLLLIGYARRVYLDEVMRQEAEEKAQP